MLLIKLLIPYFNAFIYHFVLTQLIIPNKSSDMKFLENCIEDIQENYLKPSDHIIILNLNRKYKELHFVSWPMIRKNDYRKRLILFPQQLIKADGYVILMSEEHIDGAFEYLVRTNEWNPRAKFIIVLEGDLFKLFKALERYYVFNVIALIAKTWKKIELFTYFPYNFSLPSKKRVQPVSLGFCLNRIIQNKTNLFPKKLPDRWNNVTVRISVFEFPPYAVCHNCVENQKRGIEVNIFRMVQDALGFKINYTDKTYKTWGEKLKNGSYSGIYGDLQAYNIDAAIGLFYLNSSEKWDFDMTFPYMEDSCNWVVPSADSEPKWESIIKVFNYYVWGLLLVSFIITSLVLYLTATRFYETKNYLKLYGCFLICFQCLLGQAVNVLPRMITVRIVFAVWIIFNSMISTAFQSKLTTVLNFDVYKPQISTVEEMIKSDLKFGFSGAAAYLFQDSNTTTDEYIYQNFIECPLSSASACLERAAYQRDFALIKVKRFLQFMITKFYLGPDGRPLLYFLKEQVYNVLIGMAFSKGFPLFESVDKTLFEIKSSGIIQLYYDKISQKVEKARMEAQKVQLNADNLSLNELQGVFWLLVLGWMVSVGVFLWELLCNKLVRKFRRL